MPDYDVDPSWRGGQWSANVVYDVGILSWVRMTQPLIDATNSNLYLALDTVEAKLQSVIDNTDTLETKLQSLIDQTSELENLFTTAYDYAGTANLTYAGKAAIGSSKASAVWQIKKYLYDGSNNLIDIQFADGNSNFDNSWNNRASLSYS